MKIIDLSITLDNDCMTCGTPWHEKVKIERLGTLEEVGRNTSRFVLGSHSATHMDAPLHFINGKHGIERLNIDTCIGEITCVDMRHKKAGDVVTKQDLEGVKVTKRMLFVFAWYKKWKTDEFYKGFPYFSEDAVNYLLEGNMELMALDTPSPDDHKAMLAKDVIIVEYLTNTEEIDFSKRHEIIALPLKIKGADGSPARVVLKEE